jgi:hypothetical protein
MFKPGTDPTPLPRRRRSAARQRGRHATFKPGTNPTSPPL